MDISGLAVTPLPRPATASASSASQPATVERLARAGPSNPRPARHASFERVVQGELLHRARTPYQSTHAFLDERTLDRAQPAERQAESLTQSRTAISRYLDNTRPEAVSELSQGRAVNFFV
jgi:hypothetical protein